MQALTVSALFGTAVLSGNHDSIVKVLGVIEQWEGTQEVFEECKG